MMSDQELQVIVHQGKEPNPTVQEETNSVRSNQTEVSHSNSNNRWLRVTVYTFFVISGQSVATILGRLYYDNGGKSKWLATIVQLVGFPVLLPYHLLSTKRFKTTHRDDETTSLRSRVLVYVVLGLLVGAGCYLCSIGLLYLPVSTFSLIFATQLAFNAFFSYFLNSQKLTPIILNSLFLLTISSTLLAFNNEESSNSTKVTKGQYVKGFVCTISASAGFGLFLSLQQLAFRKVLKKQTFSEVMDMIIYVSLVASCVSVAGLFASSEWKTLSGEMENYKLGKVSYVMNLVWTAITWQVFSIGGTGLIFELSSLFSNAISALGLPVVPILAVIIFHDKMNGLKVISMILAIWGFTSYVYQHYLDDKNLKKSHGISSTESPDQPLAEGSSGQAK